MSFSKEQHLKDNIKCLEIVSSLAKVDRKATPSEISQLKQYSGFGGLPFVLFDPDKPEAWRNYEKNLIPHTRNLYSTIRNLSSDEADYKRYVSSLKSSVLSSFYTPPEIVRAISDAFDESTNKTGGFFQSKKILDPSAGIGAFIEPFSRKYSEIHAIEKDLLTGKILQALYRSEKRVSVKIEPFEDIGARYIEYFDVIISNIPFGSFYALDPQYMNSKDPIKRESCQQIHNYYFTKSPELLNTNGTLCYLTTSAFSDSPNNKKYRENLMSKTDLVTVIRLPSNLFKESANTEVSTDLIIVRKNPHKKELSKDESNFIKSVLIEDYHINGLFKNSFANAIHTQWEKGKNQYGQPTLVFTHNGTTADIGSRLYDKLVPILKESLSKNNQISVSGTSLPSLQPDLFSHPVISPLPKINIPVSVPFTGDFKHYYRDKTYVIHEDRPGQLENYFRASGKITADFRPFHDLTDEQTAIIVNYVSIRDLFIELYGNEQANKTENYELRSKLNRETDRFIAQYGPFEKRDNNNLLKCDSFFHELSTAVRMVNGELQKAEIFSRPVAFSHSTKILSEQDAMTASLNLFGRIDMNFISEKTQRPVDEIVRVLSGFIYYNPVISNWEYKDKLLSGDVITKIREIERFDNKKDWYITETLQALKKVKPDPIPFHLLEFNFGERWVPTSIYEKYLTDLFKTPVKVYYSKNLDIFTISGTKNSIAETEYGVKTDSKNIDGFELTRNAFVNTCPMITKKVMLDGKEENVKDSAAIQLCNSKIDNIRNGFSTWLNHPEQQEVQNQITEIYNNTFNCFVKPDYDGSFQTLPGFNAQSIGFRPYKSQLDALWMVKQNFGGVVDHEVGGGKTLIMCMAAYELKRVGSSHKPMIVGMKANTADIAETFKKAYPHAKILYPTANDFNMKNRVSFFHKLKNNNWDCIIMTHDQFAKIPQDLQTQYDILTQELEDVELNLKTLESLTGNDATKQQQKGLIARKLNLAAKLFAISDKINTKKDDFISFSELGIDHIIVDESQAFKNLQFTTRHNRISGLGNPEGSQRALNLLTAIRSIQNDRDSDLCATLVSGTPISNSLTELFLIFKYLRPRVMERLAISNFDAWAAVFAKKTVDFEFNVTNELIQNERFRHFIKVPELSMLYAEIADVKTADEIGIKRPRLAEQLISIDITPYQAEFADRLKEFAQKGDYSLINRPNPTKKDGKMLVATSLARKMSLDMRLIDPELPDHPNSKVSICGANINEYYQKYKHVKGTQLVFCDLGVFNPANKEKFNVYTALRDKLHHEYNIPMYEIAFMQECKTQQHKDTVKNKFIKGDIRILFGSTSTLGTGNNVQNRIVAMHHLDTPWKPAEMDQRNGRGSRKGNFVAEKYNNNRVDCFLYATLNTLDNYKINLLHNKSIFIQQIRRHNLSVRSIDEGALDESGGLNYAEYVALLSGNLDLLQKCKIERQITVLESERNAYVVSIGRTERQLEGGKMDLGYLNLTLQKLTSDWEKFQAAAPPDKDNKRPFELEINGIRSNFFDEFLAKEIIQLKDNSKTGGKYQTIGQYYNFEVCIKTNTILTESSEQPEMHINKFYVKGENYYTFNNGIIGSTPSTIFSYFPNALEKIPGIIDDYKEKVSRKEESIQTCQRVINSKWDKEDQLNTLKSDLRMLETKIAAMINDIPTEPTVDKTPPTRSGYGKVPEV